MTDDMKKSNLVFTFQLLGVLFFGLGILNHVKKAKEELNINRTSQLI